MGQEQHFLPRSYLEPWCVGLHLIRYRRVGPAGKLVADSKARKSIGFEVDLYTLPPGTEANGLRGDGLEVALGKLVDQRIAGLRERAREYSASITDQGLADDLRWLMQTFAARSPTAIRRTETALTQLAAAQRSRILEMMNRARLQSSRDELRKYLDERMPGVTARGGVAAVASGDAPNGWLDGDVHVVRAEDVEKQLRDIGASEFVTFEDPVVEWDAAPSGLLASFTLSPDVLILLFGHGSRPTLTEYGEIATRHSLAPLKSRMNLICRKRVTGALLAAAAELRPMKV